MHLLCKFHQLTIADFFIKGQNVAIFQKLFTSINHHSRNVCTCFVVGWEALHFGNTTKINLTAREYQNSEIS
jgi:hypothetical protein